MVDVNPPRIGPGQVAHQLFERRRVLKRVLLQDGQQFLGLGAQPGRRQLLGVLLSLLRVGELPDYQDSFLASFLVGVLSPLRMDSRMPGIDRR